MDRQGELGIIRAAYAKQILAAALIVGNARLEAALSATRREDFLGAGPWWIDGSGTTARRPRRIHLHFPHDPARVIHNADAGLLDRYVQSSKIVQAALLLLMLEAVTSDLVSPSA
jgi:hypothetical protein